MVLFQYQHIFKENILEPPSIRNREACIAPRADLSKMPDRLTTLEKKHPHPMDARIHYVDSTHKYYLDGFELPISITGVIHNLFPQFDAAAAIDKYFDNWSVDKNSKYHALISYLRIVRGMPDSEIKSEIATLWTSSGSEASEAGTTMHAEIEAFENDGVHPAEKSKEYTQFEEWKRRQDVCEWTIYRTEWSIYNEAARVAGEEAKATQYRNQILFAIGSEL